MNKLTIKEAGDLVALLITVTEGLAKITKAIHDSMAEKVSPEVVHEAAADLVAAMAAGYAEIDARIRAKFGP
jgi:hypothetical protein